MTEENAPPTTPFQVLLLKDGEANLRGRRYKKRKTHAKSRAGCASCKLRRVKCDEAKPACQRCLRSGAPCLYGGADTGGPATSTQPRSPALLSSGDGLVHQIGAPSLDLGSAADHYPSSYGTPRYTLLRHFQHVFAELGFVGAAPQHESILSLALSRPHLLDAILAVSASHLRYHVPSPDPSHRVAEHYQQSLAVRNFQTALSQPFDGPSVDALLLTSMLLNLLTFSVVEDDDPWKSWVFSSDPNRLNWLSLHLGMKPLILSTARYRAKDSLVQWIFEASDDDRRTFNGEDNTLDRVPASWLTLCGIKDQVDGGGTDLHVFREPIRILAEIKDLEPRKEFMFLYVSFIGKLDGEFRALLEAEDVRALWMLGYWLGLQRRFSFWWCNNRVRRDHDAICAWFELRGFKRRGGAEGEFWREILFDLENAQVWPSPSWSAGTTVQPAHSPLDEIVGTLGDS